MQDRKRDTDVKKRLLDSMGEGEGGMIWENSIKTCILSSVKQIANPGWMHELFELFIKLKPSEKHKVLASFIPVKIRVW